MLKSNKKSQHTSLFHISLKVHLSLKTYAEPALHREGDVAEDGATCLRVFHSETLDVHLAPVGPIVLGMWIVNDEVRASFTTRFSRQQFLRWKVDELEHSIDWTHLRQRAGGAAEVNFFKYFSAFSRHLINPQITSIIYMPRVPRLTSEGKCKRGDNSIKQVNRKKKNKCLLNI